VRRGWKILIGLLVLLAALLVVNTIVVDHETKDAEVTVEHGQILKLPAGDVQVVVEGSSSSASLRPGTLGPPIVLIHCYTCSLHWWDRLAPILAHKHQVIRIDLLGHGGSQKPKSGYGIEEQAALVAAALDELDVQGAVVVGHSLGFPVAVALADRASQLVDRLVNIDSGPTLDSCELPFLARLEYTPVLGEAMWRLTPDFMIKKAVKDEFAPGFDIESGFANGDQVVDDLRAMTFTSYEATHDAYEDFVGEEPLDARVRHTAVPLLSIFGSEDQICDPEASQAAYQAVPGARVATIKEAGHSPNVEQPKQTAALIEEFAADAGDDTIEHPPKDIGQGKPGDRKPGPKPHRKPQRESKKRK
jgi:pimeloyl-ACP methyl ester carboxylesterase